MYTDARRARIVSTCVSVYIYRLFETIITRGKEQDTKLSNGTSYRHQDRKDKEKQFHESVVEFSPFPRKSI